MNKKQIILIFFGVIVLVVIGVMMRKGEEGDLQRSILFREECSKDEDCRQSFKTCKSGDKVSCENGCIFGICTKCVPVCPGESECGNVTCMDSVRICADERKVKCTNYCDLSKGECTSCVPDCDVTIAERVNYKAKTSKFELDSIPCVDVNYTERIEIEPIMENLTETSLPKGYSVVIGPFKVNCKGPLDLTLNIPETYTDLKALRCRGQDCNPVRIKSVIELRCGRRVLKEFLGKEDYLEPKWMPIKIEEKSLDVIGNEEIRNDKYKVEFEGDFEDLKVKLRMPKEAVEEAKNPSLKITGTPLVIEIKGEIGYINATVTMPYINMEGFEEDSIGMYINVKEGWDYIGGEINKDEGVVRATIVNIGEYLNEKNEIKLALMAILCVSCYDASLTKVYQPEKGSKDMVVLVHGFDPEPNTFQPLIDDIRLTNQPFDVWTFDYPSSKPMEDNTNELMSILEKNHVNYEKIHLVGHSIGGLIVQQALYNSYLENKKSLENKEEARYGYLDKARKVILAGALNEGSPVIEVYRNLFEDLINKEEDFLFNLNNEVIDELVNGVITPRVPGIDYRVIAGTRPYEFNLLFFKVTTAGLADIYEKNDGIITVKSAQHIGEGYIDDQCKNYWEINLAHTELIDDPVARKIIGKIITEDISERDTAILGRNKYFDLSIRDCSPEDNYVIIGKKIREELVLDETGCSCGNGYCGEGENEVNCPSDCARFLSKENNSRLIIFLVIMLVSSFVVFQYVMHKRFGHPHIKKVIGHIKSNYDIVPGEGYTHEQMRDIFLRRGWPKRVVEDSIALLREEFHHNFHKPLKRHVKRHLKKGYSKEQIKKALLNAGWREELIEKVIKGEELEPGFRLKEDIKKRYGLKLGRGMYFRFQGR